MAFRLGLVACFSLALALMFSAAACSTYELRCTPGTCAGCCDSNGSCVSGVAESACGRSGSTCSSCQSNQHCAAGSCAPGAPSRVDGGIVATSAIPDVVWVVDKSGSMLAPIESGGSCPAGCGQTNPCPGSCATRWGTIRAVLTAELNASATRARHSGVFYPTDDTCGAPTAFDVEPTIDASPDLTALATSLVTALGKAKPTGGTPTARSLQLVGENAQLRRDDREHLVVLITDGVPNCNAMNPNICDNPTSCRCTLNSCAGNTCALGCLDEAATNKAFTELSLAGARVLVVAVGLEVATNDAEGVLSLLARNSAEKLSCPGGTAAECGPDNTCDLSTRRCMLPYYVMRRALAPSSTVPPQSAFGRLDERIRASLLCRYVLSSVPSGTTLIVNGQAHAMGAGWELEGVNVARLTGTTCGTVLADDGRATVSFEVR